MTRADRGTVLSDTIDPCRRSPSRRCPAAYLPFRRAFTFQSDQAAIADADPGFRLILHGRGTATDDSHGWHHFLASRSIHRTIESASREEFHLEHRSAVPRG